MFLKISMPPRSTETGSALMAVVAVTAITMLIAATVTTMSVNALSVTVTTRSAVQADAAAAGGVDATLASLLSSAGCTNGGGYSSTVGPVYHSQTSQFVEGSGWSEGCPTAAASLVKIVSTGDSSEGGSKAQSTMESVYGYTPAGASGGGSGSSIFSYGGSNNLNSLTTLGDSELPEGELASVVIKNMPSTINSGVLNCQNSTVNGDVTIESGSFQGAGGCVINGNLTVGGTVALNSGARVLGNVTAAGSSSYSVKIEGSTTWVGGSVVAGGPVRIAGTVSQSVTAGPGLGKSVLTASGRVGGAMTLSGGISADGAPACAPPLNTSSNASQACALKKALRIPAEPVYERAGIPAPVPPITPNWANYTYKSSDWVPDFTPVVWSGDKCNVGSWNIALLTNLAASTTSTVVDATACDSLTLQPNVALKWKANVAFIAKKFNLGPANHDSFDAVTRKMSFIVPGSGTSTVPVCPLGDCHVNVYGPIVMSGKIAALIYTPGIIDNSNSTWRGQMYGRQINFGQTIAVTFVPVGLPGVDFGGQPAPSPGGGSIGTLISSRKMAEGG
jgi:hypothetical protein